MGDGDGNASIKASFKRLAGKWWSCWIGIPTYLGVLFVDEVHIWKIGSPCFCQGKFG